MTLLTRRTFLAAAAAGAALPQPALAADTRKLDRLKQSVQPAVDLRHATTGETLKVTFWRDGGYDVEALTRLNWFMRDWREAEYRRMDLDLYWALAAIRAGAVGDGHSGRTHIHSGFRTRRTNDMLRRTGHGAARNSLHIEAKAIDLRMEGIDPKAIAGYARWLQVGGVGLYPKSFVHIDTGRRRSWTG